MRTKTLCGLAIVFTLNTVLLTAQVPQVTSAAQSPTGQIQGKVVSSANGTAIGGVVVTAIRSTPNPVVSAQGIAGKDGSFTIGALPTGRYIFCVLDRSGVFLNPCEWAALRMGADVVDGKITSAVSVTLSPASVVQVRVNDVMGALVAKKSESAPPHVLVMVQDASGAFHPVRELSRDLTGIAYSLSVPYNTPLHVHVKSKAVALETETHTPVPLQGLSQAFQHDSTKLPTLQTSFQFNAIGRNP